MDETQYYSDVAMQFGDAETPVGSNGNLELSGGASAKGGNSSAAMGAQPWSKRMYDTFRDGVKRSRMESAIKTVAISKIGTGDIGALFTTSIAERMPWIRNEETPLLNMMEMTPGEDLIIDDWMRRSVERRQGQIRASNINPEATLPNYVDSIYSERYNTLAFWGDPVTSTFVGSAQAKKQRGVDTLKNDVDSELLRIRKAKNFDYWNSIEQKLFTGTNITKIGGLLSRINTNTGSAGSGDISDTLLNTANNAIATALGYKGINALFINSRGINAIRGIEIARYGGSNQISYLEWNKVMSEQFSAYSLNPDRIFEPGVGPVVPCFHENDLPSSPAMAVMMRIEKDYMPRPVGFQLGEEFGPWLFVRPVFSLRESVMVLDGGTVDDPAEESRFLFTNLL